MTTEKNVKQGKGTARAITALAVFPLICGAFCTGCSSSTGPNAAYIVTAIEGTSPECRLERESRMAVGGIKMSALKTLVKLSGENDAAELLDSMKRVEVATYRVSPSSECGLDSPVAPFGDTLVARGWWSMVMQRDGTDASWVYAHGDREGDLDGLFIVELDGSELEVVRLEGRIDRLMAEAVKSDPAEAGKLTEFAR